MRVISLLANLRWRRPALGGAAGLLAATGVACAVLTAAYAWREPLLFLPGLGLVVLLPLLAWRLRAGAASVRERQLREAIASLPDGLAIWDADDRLLLWNDAYWDMTEAAGDTLRLGMSFSELMRRVAVSGRVAEAVGREDAWVEARLAVHRNPRAPMMRSLSDGRHLRSLERRAEDGGSVLVLTDVTEQVNAMQALRESEARYATALRGANEGLWDWDIPADRMFGSERLWQMLGLGGPAGWRPGQLWPGMIHPDDLPAVEAKVQAHLKGETPMLECEYRLTRPDGAVRWLSNRGLAQRGKDGRAFRLSGSVTDITARREAETALQQSEADVRAVLDSARQSIVLIDRTGRIRTFNRAARELNRAVFGTTLAAGMTTEQMVPAAEHAALLAGLRRAFAGESIYREHQVLDRQGAPRWFEVGYVPVTAPDGLVIGACWSSDEITARRRVEAELLAAKEQAEAASRAKSAFLANISHELRTPLNAVIGFSQIMREQMFGEIAGRYRDYARDINESGQHLLALINDVLDVSKAEAGKLELREEAFALQAVVEDCLRLVQRRLEEADLVCETRIAAELPQLWADPRRLKQILLNLLSNALKFTPSGGLVRVSAAVLADGALAVTVADTGIGIAAADIPRVLTAFGQVDSSLARKYEGTGLGLPLSKRLAEMHGGTLEIDSSVGGGTRVTVTLPAERLLPGRRVA